MAFAIVAFSWAVFDDAFRLVHDWVEQRLFLAQFVGDFFWDLARVSLLLSIYHLYFHLMRRSPLGSSKLSRAHFWRYSQVKLAFCGLLVVLAFLMMCLRIAYLSASVYDDGNDFAQRDVVKLASIILCFMFDILYFLGGLEVLILGSTLVVLGKRKAGSGKISVSLLLLQPS